MIHFNVPPYVGSELNYIKQAVENKKISGDGVFTKKCNEWLQTTTKTSKSLLTTSCTHALEMTALLCDIQKGDEVIAPSYTFVSTVNAFVSRGAKVVFVDIRPDTMNIDETLIEDAITSNTKVIVPVHYAGVGCEMDTIIKIAQKHNLKVVEDAAQAVMADYNGVSLGTIGDFGCVSFHETKNYSMGEGGALFIKDKDYIETAEIIREKGTDRSKFFRGQVDKYTWIKYGSSYLPSDLNAAYLWAQLEFAEKINDERLHNWSLYFEGLKPLMERGCIELPFVPSSCKHNAHMFYIKVKDCTQRSKLIECLKSHEIQALFHYIPLHSSPAGQQYGRFHGNDVYTTIESDRILRLPMFYGLTDSQVCKVCEKITEFFNLLI